MGLGALCVSFAMWGLRVLWVHGSYGFYGLYGLYGCMTRIIPMVSFERHTSPERVVRVAGASTIGSNQMICDVRCSFPSRSRKGPLHEA